MRADPFALILVLEGLIFVVASWIMHAFPPRKINLLYGYRTKRSMKSIENWKFAQDYSRRTMFRGGLAMGVFGMMLLPFSGYRHTAVDVVLILVATFGGISCWFGG